MEFRKKLSRVELDIRVLKLLRVYERPSVEQHREACEALADITNTSAEKQQIQLPKSQIPSALPAFYPCHTPAMLRFLLLILVAVL